MGEGPGTQAWRARFRPQEPGSDPKHPHKNQRWQHLSLTPTLTGQWGRGDKWTLLASQSTGNRALREGVEGRER